MPFCTQDDEIGARGPCCAKNLIDRMTPMRLGLRKDLASKESCFFGGQFVGLYYSVFASVRAEFHVRRIRPGTR
jgi:hypothetical protein